MLDGLDYLYAFLAIVSIGLALRLWIYAKHIQKECQSWIERNNEASARIRSLVHTVSYCEAEIEKLQTAAAKYDTALHAIKRQAINAILDVDQVPF